MKIPEEKNKIKNMDIIKNKENSTGFFSKLKINICLGKIIKYMHLKINKNGSVGKRNKNK